MRFLGRTLSGLFLIGVTLALLAYAASLIIAARPDDDGRGGRPGGGAPRERVFAVNTVPFTPETITPVLSVFGEIESRRSWDIRPRTGGTIAELHPDFEDGGRVKAGDVLLRLDPVDAETALSLAQADLSDAQAELRDAGSALLLSQDDLTAARSQQELRDRALQRQQDLVARGVGTATILEGAELAAASARQSVLSRRQALQSAEARQNQAQSRLARAQIALKEAQRRLDDLTLRAEFDGALTLTRAVQGGVVAPNEAIGQLIDPTALEVAFRLSTAQYQRLVDDQGNLVRAPVSVVLDVLGTEFTVTGGISRESASVGEGLTGRLIFASIEDRGILRPGDFVQVRVTEPALTRVARLPASAVSGQDMILVIGEEDRLEEVAVNIIRRQGDDVLVRARGLRERVVVAERSPLLGQGIKVRRLNPGDEAIPEPAPELVMLSDEKRAAMIAFVEGNNRMPAEAKERILGQLKQPQVPQQLVTRLTARMGG